MIAFLIVALACIVVVPVVALSHLPRFVGSILNIARWPLMLMLITLALACIYRYGPSRDEPKWRWITWGSAFAAVAWLGFSALFSFYAANFGSFNKTYGSFGAVIGVMIWMWLSIAVVLIGGKLNAEIEHQTARDTTEVHRQLENGEQGWLILWDRLGLLSAGAPIVIHEPEVG